MKIAKIQGFGKLYIESQWELWRAKTFLTKEPETIEWIDSFNPEGVFWDIGANVGIYTIYCANKYPDMIIHAFEPHKANFLRLTQNMLLNNCLNVTLHFRAISCGCDTLKFNVGNPVVGSSGGQVGADGYEICVTTIDYMAKNCEIPNYIKIDTDGNEGDIIIGAHETLYRDEVKGVLVEINSGLEDIYDRLLDAGFLFDKFLMGKKNRKSDYNVIFTKK